MRRRFFYRAHARAQFALASVLAAALAAFAGSGCGESSPSVSPFVTDASVLGESGLDAPFDAGARAPDGGGIWGGPCLENSQCDDHIDCTFDSCNQAEHRCLWVPDDSKCQNAVFCDGVEQCDPKLGCRPGSAQDCNDTNTCTIDSCIEATRECQHTVRDVDGDGNPDGHCVEKADCDDNDPTVYAGHPEVCANGKDDNCDGQIDETPCRTPEHDTCLDPLIISQSGAYELDTTAAVADYSLSCAPKKEGHKDVVAALVLNADQDVDVVAEAPLGEVYLGLAAECANALATEIACAKGSGPNASEMARLRVHGLAKGTYPLYVWTDRDQTIVLHVTEGPKTAAPTNETCGTAAPLALATPVVAGLVGTTTNLVSRCDLPVGELVYQVTLTQTADLAVHAVALDAYGTPVLSLRSSLCEGVGADAGVAADAGTTGSGTRPPDELACGVGEQATVLGRALPPGRYFVAVSATAPTDVQLEATATGPTPIPSDETCVGAPTLPFNRTVDVNLGGHGDDIELPCAEVGAADAAYALELSAPSDVLLTMRLADNDEGSLALFPATCDDPAKAEVCATRKSSPVRVAMRNVPAGSYRAVVESQRTDPVQLTAFVRPAVPPSLVPFADTCQAPAVIGEGGGFFQGNTANAQADYSAGCDSAGGPPAGAPDQMLQLTLTTRRRVVFDMAGSAYPTLLDVRKGETCPGTEVPRGCSAGYEATRSFLDLTLDAGTYWVQVDGFAGWSGAWFLDVRTAEP